ncbi:hypothetical protein FPZ12_044650 [Amycolatopsis acidicola]|uniref:Uncharacterized protein n=1 Tax=Amycolatopsis acidicola TaxID=2596893 RepID=A0A5N0UJA1_9PSEU|nr:DUF6350 family protein [Amycolatopsis acidicola]KAA9148687.1 hypothetical protein FPZ12_044650 [Amycolatopsis acidicola]
MSLLAPQSRPGEGVREPRDQHGPSGTARVKTLVVAIAGPLVAGYAFVLVLFSLVTLLAAPSHFSLSGVLRAAGPGLLAAYQVPVSIKGSPLGVLPLLGTAVLCTLIVSSAVYAAKRLGLREPGQAVNVVAPMAAVHSLVGVTIALTATGVGISVEPLPAFLVPGFVAALCATAGVADRCGFLDAARKHLDPIALRGLKAGALGMAGLLAVAATVFALSLALSFHTARDLFSTNAPGFGSGAGMFLLSLGYLPNAVVCALAFVVGPGFSLGSVSVAAYQFSGGAVPGLPLLASMPEHSARWWPVLMLLPAAVGGLVGWYLRRSDEDPLTRLRTVAIAGALIGFGCVVLCTLAGGRLGGGPFNPVSIPVALMSVAAFAWIVIPGGLVAWLAGPRRPRAVEQVVLDEPEVSVDLDEDGESELEDEVGEDVVDEEPAEEDPEEPEPDEDVAEDEEPDEEEPSPTSEEPEQPS